MFNIRCPILSFFTSRISCRDRGGEGGMRSSLKRVEWHFRNGSVFVICSREEKTRHDSLENLNSVIDASYSFDSLPEYQWVSMRGERVTTHKARNNCWNLYDPRCCHHSEASEKKHSKSHKETPSNKNEHVSHQPTLFSNRMLPSNVHLSS